MAVLNRFLQQAEVYLNEYRHHKVIEEILSQGRKVSSQGEQKKKTILTVVVVVNQQG